MPTLRIKKAFDKTMENLQAEHPKSKGEILLESGYSPSVAEKPKLVFESKSFQEMLALIDDSQIVEKWFKWALGDSDKRVALEAGDKIMKLKNRYPKEQLDVELSRKIESVYDNS